MNHFKTITEFHEFINLPKPQHPLISVVDVATVTHQYNDVQTNMIFDFYNIAVKRMHNAKVQYGQQPFDFNEGIMSFMSPGQVFSIGAENKTEAIKKTGWVIYIHPDFLWNTSLAKTIKDYDFWDYSLNEALFLSAKEEGTINHIIQNIFQEYTSNIDKFSKQIIIAQIESLLSYAHRFYNRQFITREKANHRLLEQLDQVLTNYFDTEDVMEKGLPTVHYIAGQLHISPKYLSSLLRAVTGHNTQHHIHDKIIEKAKQKLSTTYLSVSEIAYELGFEHPQSFSKLFKLKTSQTPLKFRQAFK
jgi:AraC-like DNA-binding protein